MLGCFLDNDGVSRKAKGVSDGEVHGHVTAALPSDQENVGGSAAIATCDLLGGWDGPLHKHVKKDIAQGIVAACAPILVAAHKVVPKGVHRFAAFGAARQGLTQWQQWQPEPPPKEYPVIHVGDIRAEGSGGQHRHPAIGNGPLLCAEPGHVSCSAQLAKTGTLFLRNL